MIVEAISTGMAVGAWSLVKVHLARCNQIGATYELRGVLCRRRDRDRRGRNDQVIGILIPGELRRCILEVAGLVPKALRTCVCRLANDSKEVGSGNIVLVLPRRDHAKPRRRAPELKIINVGWRGTVERLAAAHLVVVELPFVLPLAYGAADAIRLATGEASRAAVVASSEGRRRRD